MLHGAGFRSELGARKAASCQSAPKFRSALIGPKKLRIATVREVLETLCKQVLGRELGDCGIVDTDTRKLRREPLCTHINHG